MRHTGPDGVRGVRRAGERDVPSAVAYWVEAQNPELEEVVSGLLLVERTVGKHPEVEVRVLAFGRVEGRELL